MLRAPIWMASAYFSTRSTLSDVDGLGDHGQAGGLAGLGEDAQALLAQALERVGAGARLERAAAQEVGARRLDRPRDGQRLLHGLDRAGSGHQHQLGAADRHRAHAHDAVLALHLAGDELVGVGDRDDLQHAGKALEGRRIQGALVAGDADGGALRAGDRVGLEAAGLDRLLHAADLLRGRVLPHHHQHVGTPPRRERPDSIAKTAPPDRVLDPRRRCPSSGPRASPRSSARLHADGGGRRPGPQADAGRLRPRHARHRRRHRGRHLLDPGHRRGGGGRGCGWARGPRSSCPSCSWARCARWPGSATPSSPR